MGLVARTIVSSIPVGVSVVAFMFGKYGMEEEDIVFQYALQSSLPVSIVSNGGYIISGDKRFLLLQIAPLVYIPVIKTAEVYLFVIS